MIGDVETVVPILVLVLLVLLLLWAGIRVLREYERGVVFTLGRFSGVRGPGLILLIPVVQQMQRVDLRHMPAGGVHRLDARSGTTGRRQPFQRAPGTLPPEHRHHQPRLAIAAEGAEAVEIEGAASGSVRGRIEV